MSKQNPKISGYDTSGQCIIAEELYRDSFEVDTVNLNLRRGFKNYEVTNHVGNVMAVISDHRNVERNPSDTNTIKYYKPQFLDFNYLYPYGSIMPGNYTDSGYAFGFNTQLKVDEISRKSKHYTAEFWEYNPRVVKRWNLDPKSHPSFSPYDINRGNPVWFSDPYGDSVDISGIMENDEIRSGFSAFFQTGIGREYIGRFAAKGQTVLGHTFEEDGIYHKEGINLSYTLKSSDNTNLGGNTGWDFKGDNNERLQINVKINKNTSFDDLSNVVGRAFTIVHETFIHVDLFADDWIDDGLMNTSNASKDSYRYINVGKSKYFGVSEAHHYTARDAAKKIEKPDLFWKYGHRALKAINEWYNTGLNSDEVWYRMWEFGY